MSRPDGGFSTGLKRCECGHPLVNHWQTGKRLCMACPDGACPDFRAADPASDRPDGDGGNVITCTHDGLAEHLWEPPQCPVAIPAGTWAVRPAEPTVEGRLAELDALRATVARVEALHWRDRGGWCAHCGEISEGDDRAIWPCTTRRVLDGTDG